MTLDFGRHDIAPVMLSLGALVAMLPLAGRSFVYVLGVWALDDPSLFALAIPGVVAATLNAAGLVALGRRRRLLACWLFAGSALALGAAMFFYGWLAAWSDGDPTPSAIATGVIGEATGHLDELLATVLMLATVLTLKRHPLGGSAP